MCGLVHQFSPIFLLWVELNDQTALTVTCYCSVSPDSSLVPFRPDGSLTLSHMAGNLLDGHTFLFCYIFALSISPFLCSPSNSYSLPWYSSLSFFSFWDWLSLHRHWWCKSRSLFSSSNKSGRVWRRKTTGSFMEDGFLMRQPSCLVFHAYCSRLPIGSLIRRVSALQLLHMLPYIFHPLQSFWDRMSCFVQWAVRVTCLTHGPSNYTEQPQRCGLQCGECSQ